MTPGTPEPRLRLLHDGQCPFCRAEVRWLGRRDRRGRLLFEDIADPSFDPKRYGLAASEVAAVLHAVLPDGRVVRGMDAFRAAYRAAGLGWLVAPTAWPLLRWLCDGAYGLFARHRVRLGRLFGRRCPDGTCALHGPTTTQDAQGSRGAGPAPSAGRSTHGEAR